MYVLGLVFAEPKQRRGEASYIDNAKTKLPREAIKKGSSLPNEAKAKGPRLS